MSRVLECLERDPALICWVLIPISVVMVSAGVLRQYCMILLRSHQPNGKKIDMRSRQLLVDSGRFITNYVSIPRESFVRRRDLLCSQLNDSKEVSEKESQHRVNPGVTDPMAMDGMMTMMKNNMAVMIPQSLIMAWINAFYNGYVIMRLPISVPVRFKAMLQAGILTDDLNARWVSSLSWYFLNLFGLQAIFVFLLGDNDAVDVTTQVIPPAASPVTDTWTNTGPHLHKHVQDLLENIMLLSCRDVLHNVEDRIIASQTDTNKADTVVTLATLSGR